MGLLRIDESKCKRDGMCVRECPVAIIRIAEAGGYPFIVPGGESACLVCGHCVAVCPHGALSHEQIPIEACPNIEEERAINEEQAIQFLRSRRSIRLYEDRPVEKENIRKLIEIARYAPTAGNSQLVEWLVLTDRAEIRRIGGLTIDWLRQFLKDNPRAAVISPYLPMLVEAWDSGCDAVLRGAPVLVVASAPREAVNGLIDVTLALSYLDLLAPTIGLGTCWAGLLQRALLASPPLRETLGIPERHSHHYPVMLGYPVVRRYYRLPERKPPKITFR